MKKFIRNFVFCLLFLSISAMSLFFNIDSKKQSKVFASEPKALENSLLSDVSIFIRKPTYSVLHDKKLYFLDEADKLLKSYDTENHIFDSEYLDLSNYTIIDAAFFNGSIYILVSEITVNKVVKINLSPTLSIDSNFNVSIEKDYSSFFIDDITFDDKDYTLLAYTAIGKNSKVTIIDNEETSQQTFELKFNQSDENHAMVMNGLKDTIFYQDNTGRLYIVFVCVSEIAYYPITSYSSLTQLSGESTFMQTLSHTTIPNYSFSELNIIDVEFAKIGETDYLAISLSDITNYSSQHIQVYSFDFGSGSDTIKYLTNYTCKNAEYLIFNKDHYSFVDKDNQKLFFTKIWTEQPGLEVLYRSSETEIDNPSYKIDYYNTDEFIYKKTENRLPLFEDPWGANSTNFINANSNIIIIGKAKLVGSEIEINDYDYCLYTNNDRNYYGFVKNELLLDKAEISPEKAGYKPRVSIWPRTTLYSLPTTITGGKIGGDSSPLTPEKICVIEDNSEIKVIDVLKNYVANNIQMIKVRVNGTQEGYIDAKCIREPSDVKNFVITNATIKNDDTTVYLSASSEASTLSFKLNKGKNVRINGKRDTKTGFTSITFNDEYGNEFSGYIETDYIKSDSWSTLQIVGCVLIAINIGLLVLILLYKKNHLGNRGQKIDKE